MDKSSGLKVVTLPDGEVTISTTPLSWWTEQNGSGLVDPNNIAPDPKNVRKRTSKAKMAELRESVRQHGVMQPMNLTPLHLAPWVEVDKKYRNCFFLAVGGHRRREAAIEECIGAVPIIVKIYPSEKEHRLAVSLLNKGNEDLSDLELGYEIAALQEVGWSVEELSEEFKRSAPALYARLHLTWLCPELQNLLDPELAFKDQLGTGLGGNIGSIKDLTLAELVDFYESVFDSLKKVPTDAIVAYKDLPELDETGRRFAMQRALYAVIKLHNLSADRATNFVNEHRFKLQTTGSHGGRKTRTHEPMRRKEVITNLVSSVKGSLPAGWKNDEWLRIFSYSPKEEIEQFRDLLRGGEGMFKEWADTLDRLAKTKPVTRPEVLELMKKKK